jgi:hypothetical protein
MTMTVLAIILAWVGGLLIGMSLAARFFRRSITEARTIICQYMDTTTENIGQSPLYRSASEWVMANKEMK